MFDTFITKLKRVFSTRKKPEPCGHDWRDIKAEVTNADPTLNVGSSCDFQICRNCGARRLKPVLSSATSPIEPFVSYTNTSINLDTTGSDSSTSFVRIQ